MLFAILIIGLPVCRPVRAEPDEISSRGRIPIPTKEAAGYREKWALIIGINYQGRQDELRGDAANELALPSLNNAVNDANGLARTVKEFYDYKPENTILLTEEKATYAAIEEAITKLCDPARVAPDDSVLFFFSGHGLQLQSEFSEDGNSVAILPYNVQLSGGRPIGNMLKLPYKLFDRLAEIPAQHKLVILDCCYSGKIFDVPPRKQIGFQGRSETENRSDADLQAVPTFQAMASCRATQVASDGRAQNSPFTAALIDGLRRIPARDEADRRVWANRLLAHIRPSFSQSQRPDCRNLLNSTGEFCFYPGPMERFEQFRLDDIAKGYLKAMVASRQGNWWFNEMPWFIPSIREEIIRKIEQTQVATRASGYADLIELKELRGAMREVLRLKQQKSESAIEEMRRRHCQLLLATQNDEDFTKTLTDIAIELASHHGIRLSTVLSTEQQDPDSTSRTISQRESAASSKETPAAVDTHLLAIILHALKWKDDATQAYSEALKAYDAALSENERTSLQVLRALCRADYGEFLLNTLEEPLAAADEFAEANRQILALAGERRLISADAAGFFRISVLCQEADAWLQLNHWPKANERLFEALNYAQNYAPNHYLHAHTHRRRAWAEMIQWHILEAERSFQRSNEILTDLFRDEARRNQSASLPVTTNDAVLPAEATQHVVDPTSITYTSARKLDPAFSGSGDHQSKIAFLHNLHGMAMAKRYRGDTIGAAADYRWLIDNVERAYADFRARSADIDIEQQFLERLVNTHERLGDCNLFGDPSARDLNEAVDDYRRAFNWIPRINRNRRDRLVATVLYKQALALSLPSPVQDTELALEMCQHADQIFSAQRATAVGLFQALGELTSKIVAVLHANGERNSDATPRECDCVPVLREAIYAFRDRIGQSPHRDELELALFASKVLLECAPSESRLQTLGDADLLLGLCRIALPPYSPLEGPRPPSVSESVAYLRPYYDVAMQSKIGAGQTHVKDLLEIQWEATQGRYYTKSEQPAPVLAMYLLGNECYLLIDLPRADSKCVSLSTLYDAATVRRACQSTKEGLLLPHEVQRSLITWREENAQLATSLVLRWEDPLRGIGGDAMRWGVTYRGPLEHDDPNTLSRNGKGRFPFQLPDGFADPTMPMESAESKIGAASGPSR
jgi:hypothetical protein